MKMVVIGLVMVLGAAGVAIGQEGGGAASAAATQGVKMEQGHPWPVNDGDATKEQLQAKGKWLRDDARGNAYPGIGGTRTIDRDQVRKRLDELRLRYDQWQLDWSEKRARLTAVAKKIAELTGQAKEAEEKDMITQELQKSAEARDMAAQRLQLMSKSGTAAETDVEGAVAAAADAHVKVEERREAVKMSVGGGILPELNKELVELSIDQDVQREQMKALAMLIFPLEKSLDDLEELDRVKQLLATKYHAAIDE